MVYRLRFNIKCKIIKLSIDILICGEFFVEKKRNRLCFCSKDNYLCAELKQGFIGEKVCVIFCSYNNLYASRNRDFWA